MPQHSTPDDGLTPDDGFTPDDGSTTEGPTTEGPALHSPRPPVEEGGEAACLLVLVCTECGRLATERGARHCLRCGTVLPQADL